MNKFLEAGLRKAASAQGLRKEALFKTLDRAKAVARRSRDVLGAAAELGTNIGVQRKLRNLPGARYIPDSVRDAISGAAGSVSGKSAKLLEDLKYLTKHVKQGTRRGWHGVRNLVKEHPGYAGLLGGTAYGSIAGNLIGRHQGRRDAEEDIKGSVLDYLSRL